MDGSFFYLVFLLTRGRRERGRELRVGLEMAGVS